MGKYYLPENTRPLSIVNAMQEYQAMLDATREGMVKRELAEIPADLTDRANRSYNPHPATQQTARACTTCKWQLGTHAHALRMRPTRRAVAAGNARGTGEL